MMRTDQTPATERGAGTRKGILQGLLLLTLTALAYLPALGATFIWDDPDYLVNNPVLRGADGLSAIWTEPLVSPQYYPLVFTTFWAEYRLWGLWYPAYHAANVLLHALNGWLLWRLLRRLEVPGAWLAALIFALHPVHVESVAWITERKNVLSTFFYLAALRAYLRFAPPDGSRSRGWVALGWYVLALGLYVAALLSKTVTCSLPAAILLIGWWKRGRLGDRDVWPLVPFFAVGLLFGLLTATLERYHVGTFGRPWALSPIDRVLIAGRALWFYAGKLAWPSPLIFIYPRWRIDAGAWRQFAYVVGAVAVLVALWGTRRRLGRGPFVAVAFFAMTLFPALGFIDTAPMRYSFVADHFQYLASPGLIALFAALATLTFRRLPASPPWLGPLLAGGLLLALGTRTFGQCFAYQSRHTLWADTLAKDPDCWMARNNLGMLLCEEGRFNEAEAQFAAAARVNPECMEAQFNLVDLLQRRGALDEAEARLPWISEHWPDRWETHDLLGKVARRRGDHEAADRQLRIAQELKDDVQSLGLADRIRFKVERKAAAGRRSSP